MSETTSKMSAAALFPTPAGPGHIYRLEEILPWT